MANVFGLDTTAVRTESERIVSALGGGLCRLPSLDRSDPRDAHSIMRRVAVMNAMVQIHFGAPVEIIRAWIETHTLLNDVSRGESQILTKRNDDITDQEDADLFWYIEALWALVWVGSLIDEIAIERPVGDELAGFLPDLKSDESPEQLYQKFTLRPPAEIYQKLDLYYIAHWYARDGHLRGLDTSPFLLDVIMERRKALEWVMDSSVRDWDDTPEDT